MLGVTEENEIVQKVMEYIPLKSAKTKCPNVPFSNTSNWVPQEKNKELSGAEVHSFLYLTSF